MRFDRRFGRPSWSPRLARAVVLLAVVVFLALSWIQADKPLQLDAVDQPNLARSVTELGFPSLYRGEQEARWGGFFTSPLYAYLLALLFLAGLTSASALHMLGALTAVLTCGVTVALLRTLLGPRRALRVSALWVPVFLLQPYTLQVWAIPSLAAGVYAPLLALQLLCVARLGWRDGQPRRDAPTGIELAAPALLFALLLFADLAALPVYLLLPLLLHPPHWSRRRALRYWALSILGAVEVFILGSACMDVVADMDTSATLRTSLLALATDLHPFEDGIRAAAARFGSNLGQILPFQLRWSGVAPWIVLVATRLGLGLSRRSPAGSDRPAARQLDRLIFASALVSLALAASAPGTYASVPFFALAPYYPLLLLPFALAATPAAERPARATRAPGARSALLLLTLGVGFWLGAGPIGDRIIWHANTTGAWLYPQTLLLWFTGIATTLVCAALAWRPSERRRRALRWIAIFVVGAQAGIATAQSRAPYSTSYNYGQRGLAATARFLGERAEATDGILCMKDLGYRLARPYWDSFPAFAGDDGERQVLESLSSGAIRFAVFTRAFGQDILDSRPRLAAWIRAHAKEIASFGDYAVFEIRERPAPPGGAS